MSTMTIPVLGNRDVDKFLSDYGFGSGARRSLEKDNIIPKGITIRARGASATLYSSLVLEVIVARYLQKRHKIEVDLDPLVDKVKRIQEQAIFKSVCEEIESSLASYGTFEETRWAEFNKLNSPIVQSMKTLDLTRETEQLREQIDDIDNYIQYERGYVDRIEDDYAVLVYKTANGYRSEEVELSRLEAIDSDFEGAPIDKLSTSFSSTIIEQLHPGINMFDPAEEAKLAELDQAMRQSK